MSEKCYHRWSTNNRCIIPGCRAVRDPDKPLGPHERLHVPWKRIPKPTQAITEQLAPDER